MLSSRGDSKLWHIVLFRHPYINSGLDHTSQLDTLAANYSRLKHGGRSDLVYVKQPDTIYMTHGHLEHCFRHDSDHVWLVVECVGPCIFLNCCYYYIWYYYDGNAMHCKYDYKHWRHMLAIMSECTLVCVVAPWLQHTRT